MMRRPTSQPLSSRRVTRGCSYAYMNYEVLHLTFFFIILVSLCNPITSFLSSINPPPRYHDSSSLLIKECNSLHKRLPSYHPHFHAFNTNPKKLRSTLLKLRNFDIPEALIFYGLDTVLDRVGEGSAGDEEHKLTVRPGVLRLMKESKDIKTPIIILSEHLKMDEISKLLNSVDANFESFTEEGNDKILHIRSSLEEYIVDYDVLFATTREDDGNDDYEYPPTFSGKGVGYAPSPATLMDAIHTIWIEPRGFGGSSGFGVKYADAIRNPLPQHCVVFVSKSTDDYSNSSNNNNNNDNDHTSCVTSSGSISRDRCLASRQAGMRVMYMEGEKLGSCTAEDISDGIVESLGTENDWSMVTMDDISTPGSFWLNMAQPKDENGDRVNSFDVVEYYETLRKKKCADDSNQSHHKHDAIEIENNILQDELDEDEIQKMLANIATLE